MFLRNPTYDWQETESLRALFSSAPVAADLLDAIGFGVDDALGFVDALWKIGFDRFHIRAVEANAVADALEADVRRAKRHESLAVDLSVPCLTTAWDDPARTQLRWLKSAAAGRGSFFPNRAPPGRA